MKVRLHVPEPIAGVPLLSSFYGVFDVEGPKNLLFKEALPPDFFQTDVEYVAPEDAVAVVLPNNFLKPLSADEAAYVTKYADLAESLGKPLLVFACGDYTDALRFDPRAYVFRLSVYRTEMQPQDIVIATETQDLGAGGITIRPKSEIPMVSFCGMASLPTAKSWLRYLVTNLMLDLKGFIRPSVRFHKRGVYWRRKAMAACRGSKQIRTNFIVRRTFSGHARSIELDPAKARAEFLDSMVNTDFVLAPKGDGNYSNRFLEALCLGRIPVLIDTDTVLPFEGSVSFEDVLVRVPARDISNTPMYIRAYYDALSPQEWEARQRAARRAYEEYLRFDASFRYFFTKRLPELPAQPPEA